MVGILLSYWDGLFSGATLVSGRVFDFLFEHYCIFGLFLMGFPSLSFHSWGDCWGEVQDKLTEVISELGVPWRNFKHLWVWFHGNFWEFSPPCCLIEGLISWQRRGIFLPLDSHDDCSLFQVSSVCLTRFGLPKWQNQDAKKKTERVCNECPFCGGFDVVTF